MEPDTSSASSTIEAYLDLMYDADDKHFPRVFHELCQIHGMRGRELTSWPASEFRALMLSRPSPASTGSPREQEIVRVEEISSDMTVAKVRVRIGQICFLDYLILHRIGGDWLVTSKGFHVERVLPPGS